jgi:hypothetical protein
MDQSRSSGPPVGPSPDLAIEVRDSLLLLGLSLALTAGLALGVALLLSLLA